VRELIGRVIAIEYKLHHPTASYTNPTDTDLLKIKFPHLIKPPSDSHFQAIDWQIAPDVFAGLDDKRRENVSYSCLSFVMLTACRSEEARLASWDEISADGTMWNLPADRMTKTKVRHVVPLSTEAQKLLSERKVLCRKPEGLIFPSPESAPGEIEPLTSDALLRAFQRTCGKATVHGLRSTFMDWGMDHEYSFEALDKCLAHKLTDKVAAAYARTSLVNLRRPIMEAWGNFLISKI
jgi:integrase